MIETEIIPHEAAGIVRVKLVSNGGRGWPRHIHSDYEIGMLLAGELVLSAWGTQYRLTDGMFYMVPPYEMHSVESSREDLQLIIQIHPDFYLRLFPMLRYLVPGKKVISQREIAALLVDSAISYYSEDPAEQLHCSALLFEAMYRWLKTAAPFSAERVESEKQWARLGRMNRLTDYIETHFAENITLSGLAAGENITPCYLSHLFREDLGIGFQEYLGRVRLVHAVRLLRETDLRILDVCLETGISSSHQLGKLIRAEYGCSTKEFLASDGGKTNCGCGAAKGGQFTYSSEKAVKALKNYRRHL